MICVEITGKARTVRMQNWKTVVCDVRYTSAADHRQIVEGTFRDHDGLDVDYVQRHHPDHFGAPHNVARAILLYNWFRPHALFFEYAGGKVVPESALPQRTPDVEAPSFALWISVVEAHATRSG